MKNILRILMIFSLTGTALLARPRNRVANDLQKLLSLHQTEMQSFFAALNTGNKTLPTFFCDVSFTNEAQVKQFLRNVSTTSPSGQIYSHASFTQFVSINGDMRSVSYNLTNNGGNVTFVKSTNINGQMLRAIYEYDGAHRKLKTATFDGKKAIKNSEYSI